MKKFLLSIIIALVATMLINLPVSHAKQVRFADVGAENFVAQIKQILYSDDFKKSVNSWEKYTVRPPILTDVFLDRNFDFSGDGLTAWSCYYGREDSTEKDGQLVFLTDGGGYVFEVIMIAHKTPSSAQAGAAILTAFLPLMNLTESEHQALYKNGNTWSSHNNRRYTMTSQYTEYETYISFQAFDS